MSLYIKDCESNGENVEAMKVIESFIADVDEDLCYNVHQKIKNF